MDNSYHKKHFIVPEQQVEKEFYRGPRRDKRIAVAFWMVSVGLLAMVLALALYREQGVEYEPLAHHSQLR